MIEHTIEIVILNIVIGWLYLVKLQEIRNKNNQNKGNLSIILTYNVWYFFQIYHLTDFQVALRYHYVDFGIFLVYK